MNDAQITLLAAQTLISDPADWCKGHFALTDTGEPTDAISTNACRWCSYGALQATSPSIGICSDARINFEHAIGMSITIFNDSSKTTHADVMAMFDRAIELAVADPRLLRN